MLAPVSHNLALTTIIRKRLLPVNGKVVVKLNQHILATDTIAEAEYSHKHHLIDIAHILGIKASVADKMVSVRVGEKLAAGTVVAKAIKVEHSGRVVAAGGGQILLDISEKPLELQAGISGEVIELIQHRGAIIQEVGALVQGVWGNGRISSGTLHVLAEKPAEILTSKQLDMSLRSLVIMAGSCQDAEALKAAAEITVRALILSSIHPSLLGLARKMPYPIVVTDAIGKQAMNANAYKIISTNNQREKVTVNAEAFQRYKGTRPEIIIPLPHTDLPSTPREVDIFAPGQKVRLRRAPHAGATGTLVNLPSGMQTLPNGLRVLAGEVKLNFGEQVTVPLVNLEVLG